jgi:chemotaxis methyl-accepting protein methylase
MTAFDDLGLARIRQHLTRLDAGALTLYKPNCFERRLAARLRARSVSTVAEYAGLLDREPQEAERLVSALAIGVTGFFRNPESWRRLAALLAARDAGLGPFRAWSAGCATGEEAYSMALLLGQLESAGAGGVIGWEVRATDLDERSLAVAREGAYSGRAALDIREVVDLPVELSEDRVQVSPAIRSRVHFAREDLLSGGAVGQYDLILCRNVLISFGDEGQARIAGILARALRPGGLLMLGKAEFAARDPVQELELLDGRERIYRRAA